MNVNVFDPEVSFRHMINDVHLLILFILLIVTKIITTLMNNIYLFTWKVPELQRRATASRTVYHRDRDRELTEGRS